MGAIRHNYLRNILSHLFLYSFIVFVFFQRKKKTFFSREGIGGEVWGVVGFAKHITDITDAGIGIQ